MRTPFRMFVLISTVLALLVAACGDDGSVLSGEPSVTSAQTSATTATTQAPPETTAAPPATTEAPPETTEAPPETTEAPPETTEPPPPPIPVITPFDASETNADPLLIMTVVIPIVSGVPDAASSAMNAAIGAETLGITSQFKDDILGGPPPMDPGVGSEMALGYTPGAVAAEILSIRFDVYAYYSGAAHGNSAIFTMSFAPQTGAFLNLADILVPGTLPVMASIVEQHLIDDIYGGDAAEASSWIPVLDAAALDGWVVTVDGLLFGFDQYEVGFGAMGAPTILVPWAELGAVIHPDGPASVYAFGA